MDNSMPTKEIFTCSLIDKVGVGPKLDFKKLMIIYDANWLKNVF